MKRTKHILISLFIILLLFALECQSVLAAPARTITDEQSGIVVSGDIEDSAILTVSSQSVLHKQGCPACDEIRNHRSQGSRSLALYDISLTQYHGKIAVSIPINEKYNNITLSILHCNGGASEYRTVTPKDGLVSAEFDQLSPFCVLYNKDFADSGGGQSILTFSILMVGALVITLIHIRQKRKK